MHSDINNGCGCNGSENEQACGCSEEKHNSDGCGCGGDHNHQASCGHDHEHHSVTLVLQDDTELECPVVDAFEINEQQYIALLHPKDETVLLYRFYENDDDTIDIETIETDEEFELVSKTFMALQED